MDSSTQDSQDSLSVVLAELRVWRQRCFEMADLYPTTIFPITGGESSAAAAGAMGRHVALTIGGLLADRIAVLEAFIPPPSDINNPLADRSDYLNYALPTQDPPSSGA